MSGFFTLQVGGIDLDVRGNARLYNESADPTYSGFKSESPSSPADRVDITVEAADPAPPASARCVWESGESWAMYRADGRRIITGPRRHKAWSAEMSGENVTVRCGPAMLRSEGGRTVASNPVRYPLDQILLMYALARRRGMIVHSCGADFGGRGAMFLGRSRAGKSTIARLLAAEGGSTVLSDDRIIVRLSGGQATMYGTPWPGEAGMAVNRSAPMKVCFLLSKAGENRIEDLPRERVADALLPVVSIPWYEGDVAAAVLDTCDAFAAAVPFRVLHFRKDADAAAMVREAVEGCQA